MAAFLIDVTQNLIEQKTLVFIIFRIISNISPLSNLTCCLIDIIRTMNTVLTKVSWMWVPLTIPSHILTILLKRLDRKRNYKLIVLISRRLIYYSFSFAF